MRSQGADDTPSAPVLIPRLKHLLALASPFPDHPGTVRLHEPADADPAELSRQLLSGQYPSPFLLDSGNTRSLHFNLDFVQSSMSLDAPEALDLPYTRYMMAFVLFHQRPRRLALIGLGGGSLAKFCHRHLPAAELTAIEFDHRIIAFRDAFKLPEDNSRFRVIQGDGADFVAADGPAFDVLMVDAFDAAGTAPGISEPEFYRHARRRLAASGILVANLSGEMAVRLAQLDIIAREFGDNLLVAAVEDGCNHVVFAFRDPGFEPRWKWIDSQAPAMKARFGIDFPLIARALKRGSAQRLLG